MSKSILEHFFLGHGRIPRATMIYRLVALAAVCAAFGTLTSSLAGEWCAGIFAGIFVWCSIAVSIQRLHDSGRSGHALFYAIVPVLGPVWLLTQLLKTGVEGSNRYGKNPVSRSGYLTVDISH